MKPQQAPILPIGVQKLLIILQKCGTKVGILQIFGESLYQIRKTAAAQIIQLAAQGGFRSLLTGMLPGLVFGGAVLALSLIMERILKKDAMGGGDIKLLAVLGLFFSFPEMLLLLLFACVLGILMAAVLMKLDSETAFPFGPALSAAAWVTLLFGESLIGWYLSLFL